MAAVHRAPLLLRRHGGGAPGAHIVFDGDDRRISSRGWAWRSPCRCASRCTTATCASRARATACGPSRCSPPPGGGLVCRAQDRYADQLAGKRIANKETFNAAGQKLLTDWAVWDAFKLAQTTADGFTIQKRTNPQSCWLDAVAGRRASAWCSPATSRAGSRSGVKNFWQSYPASLEVRGRHGGGGRTARLALVARSARDGPAPLRHPGARSGFQLRGRAARLQHAARRGAHQRDDAVPHAPPCRPRRRPRCTGASWPRSRRSWWRRRSICTRPGRSASGACPTAPRRPRRRLEDQLDAAFEFYRKEVEQRHWYGFWNYGDVMHQHDGARHDVALRHRRLRLGQHRTGHRHVALVQLPAHRAAPTSSAWRRP